MSAIPLRPGYTGRFAPSPTGPLHAGSLVAALASWLDARAHGGTWLVRIEDIDPPRCQPGADQEILRQLAACGLHSDAPVVWQSRRHALYAQALEQLVQDRLAYPCGCTRKDLEAVWQAMGLAHERHVERPYPGTCRNGLHGKPARAWRFALQRWIDRYPPDPAQTLGTPAQAAMNNDEAMCAGRVRWQDRRLGPQQQDVLATVGDFVLRRADGLWAYQLAVVVDDGEQGITDIVRGEDLADNTPRQILLQQALHLPLPRYLHTPLVRMANGEKLSKQHGAPAVDLSNPLAALTQAAACLDLPAPHHSASTVPDALALWVRHWREIQRD
ncbi:tRNA glutamyl-Q(34) synthetase GluQRS [Comamonas sp. w2-DMI]|uniref:tRNA glutamyl-Q(34) synthetase GluQRS n=1 Tax=Comamonas sp. w2-DMI TaxID=3126391 RepID=UPI0032E5196D